MQDKSFSTSRCGIIDNKNTLPSNIFNLKKINNADLEKTHPYIINKIDRNSDVAILPLH